MQPPARARGSDLVEQLDAAAAAACRSAGRECTTAQPRCWRRTPPAGVNAPLQSRGSTTTDAVPLPGRAGIRRAHAAGQIWQLAWGQAVGCIEQSRFHQPRHGVAHLVGSAAVSTYRRFVQPQPGGVCLADKDLPGSGTSRKNRQLCLLWIPPQVHLRRPCYDFSFL